MENWVYDLPLRDITKVSKFYRVEPELIAAFVSVESAGNTKATRYESHYRYMFQEDDFSQRNNTTRDTEIVHQKTSWGLMQVMGGVAREQGFPGPMTDLCKPAIGLTAGIKHLTKFIDKYDDLESAISAYNQGGNYKNDEGLFKNQAYVDKILARYKYLKSF